MTSKKIEQLARVLQSDLRCRLSLAEAAEYVGIETTYFSKRFRTVVGVSFSEWNRTIRIESAKIFLQNAELTVSKIADRVGYRDVTTFERNFRKAERMSPKAYRLMINPHPVRAVITRNADKYTRNAE